MAIANAIKTYYKPLPLSFTIVEWKVATWLWHAQQATFLPFLDVYHFFLAQMWFLTQALCTLDDGIVVEFFTNSFTNKNTPCIIEHSTTFYFSCWKVTNKLTFCMFWTQVVIASSSYFVNTPWGPIFKLLVLPLMWFKSEVNKMFQYLLAFFKDVCPLYNVSMASSNWWFTHLPYLDALGCLLILAKLCKVVVIRDHCHCVDVVVGCKCWFYC